MWLALLLAQTLAPEAKDAFTLQTAVSAGVAKLTDFRFLPDGRVVIARQTGEVMVRRTDGTLVQAGQFSVDATSEKGLLGVEVHPLFTANRLLFFYYSASAAAGGTDLDRHRVVSVPLADDDTLGAQTVLLRGLRGPANHDGGALAVGPDEKLYVGVGDSGCNSNLPPPPPDSNITNYTATCLTTANGKILRINLDGTIPADNPLVGKSVPACDPTSCAARPDPANLSGAPRSEIWAWGFRNPFRFSFDALTGALWAADVGEVSYEEIDLVTRGQHYGWPFREGAVGDAVTVCRNLGPGGFGSDCVDPKYFCKHGAAQNGLDGGCQSITGGVFIDSPRWPADFRGRYYFGDNSTGAVWSLPANAARDGFAGPRADFASGFATPVRFLLGPDENLYVGNYGGSIVQIAPAQPPDAGSQDAGPAPDGGAAPVRAGGGCNCGGSAALLAALFALTFRSRRRPSAD